LTQTDCNQGEGLTPTLHGFFQGLAGRDMANPLTFGDLWWGPRRVDGSRDESGPRQIDLQVITTAVNQQRPMRLPGEPGVDPMQEYFYDPHEWDALFPKPVIAHLRARGRPVTLKHDDGRELLALPLPKDWPVLMAARFSLSFPILLSAVPMYIAVPRRAVLRSAPDAKGRPFEARKVYFSDGGITSNCPIHLFDAPLPRYPTFGINLYEPKDGDKRCVVRSDEDDPELRSSTTDDATGWRNPVPFLKAVFYTMFGWRDNLQRLLPGYRERIVHIAVPPKAGGLHLAMKTDTILLLATLGKIAARRLHRDFSVPRTVGGTTAWERHRWTRARSTLSALRKYLTELADRVGAGDPDYDRLLRQSTPDRYAFADEAARQQALCLVHDIQTLVRRLEATNPDDAMDGNRPTPQPRLHMSPPW
jgi:predicted acylesterase/phospholipase RssA